MLSVHVAFISLLGFNFYLLFSYLESTFPFLETAIISAVSLRLMIQKPPLFLLPDSSVHIYKINSSLRTAHLIQFLGHMMQGHQCIRVSRSTLNLGVLLH